jgi:hypothetical protein
MPTGVVVEHPAFGELLFPGRHEPRGVASIAVQVLLHESTSLHHIDHLHSMVLPARQLTPERLDSEIKIISTVYARETTSKDAKSPEVSRG